jgi:hypothetical protein
MITILTQEQNTACLTDVIRQLSDDSIKHFYLSIKNTYQLKCVDYFENGRNDMLTPEIERLRYMLETLEARLKHLNIFSDVQWIAADVNTY